MVQIERFNISFPVTSLNRLSETQREGHLKRLVKIFGYLQHATGGRNIIVISPDYMMDISGKGTNNSDWIEKSPDATEYINEGLPEPRGSPLSTTVYLDSNHDNDQVTRIPVYVVM